MHVVLLVFFLRLVCPVLPVSLDCPFLIVPSVFSDVYLIKVHVIVMLVDVPKTSKTNLYKKITYFYFA
jgi:hypothetical protein